MDATFQLLMNWTTSVVSSVIAIAVAVLFRVAVIFALWAVLRCNRNWRFYMGCTSYIFRGLFSGTSSTLKSGWAFYPLQEYKNNTGSLFQGSCTNSRFPQVPIRRL